MGRLANKTALITGGALGMGAAHVRRFVAEGAKVFFTDILAEEGAALAAELGAGATFAVSDVTRQVDWLQAVSAAEAAYGPINILVNNAGIVLRGPVAEMSEADYRRVIDVNQVSVFLGMKTVIPSMRRAGGGSIINISSVAGLVGRPDTVAYSASKFAVRGMSKVAATELGPEGIRVNSVHPGPILTPMLRGMDARVRDSVAASVPMRRMAEPEEVTNVVLFLASDEASFCSGGEYAVDGAMTAG